MAIKRPSFLKRQKEQKRAQRAQAKRDARRERKQAKESPSAQSRFDEQEPLAPADNIAPETNAAELKSS